MNIDESMETWRRRRWVSALELARAMEVTPRTVRNWWYSRKTPLKAWMAYGDTRFIRFTAASAIEFVLAGFEEP